MADTKYLVKKVETCSKCNGKKFVEHPAWIEYWQELGEKGRSMSMDDDRKWFEDHGWLGFTEDTDCLPPESYLCGYCEGEGEIICEVNLLEILPELMKALELGTLSTTA